MNSVWMRIVCSGLMGWGSLWLGAGCQSVGSAERGLAMTAPARQSAAGSWAESRKMIWRAYLTLEVWNVSNAVAQASDIAQANGGYVEQASNSGAGSASLRLRIPAPALTNAVGAFEKLGRVESRYLQSEDVTEQYIDAEARLKNLYVLRDRLRQLADKATEVKDLLAIETELNRVQGDIDSLEGRLKALKGQVDFATLELTLRRKEILGPLGYVFQGTWWLVKKLFVIRE